MQSHQESAKALNHISLAEKKAALERQAEELKLERASRKFYSLTQLADQARSQAQRTVQLITQSESELETELLETRNEEIAARQRAFQLAEEKAKEKQEAVLEAKVRVLELKKKQ